MGGGLTQVPKVKSKLPKTRVQGSPVVQEPGEQQKYSTKLERWTFQLYSPQFDSLHIDFNCKFSNLFMEFSRFYVNMFLKIQILIAKF